MCDGKARGMKGEKNSILFGRAAQQFTKYRVPEKFNGGKRKKVCLVCSDQKITKYVIYLVVSTHLNGISQIGSFPQGSG